MCLEDEKGTITCWWAGICIEKHKVSGSKETEAVVQELEGRLKRAEITLVSLGMIFKIDVLCLDFVGETSGWRQLCVLKK